MFLHETSDLHINSRRFPTTDPGDCSELSVIGSTGRGGGADLSLSLSYVS